MIARIVTAIKNCPNSVLCHLYQCDPSSNFFEENKVNCENKIDCDLSDIEKLNFILFYECAIKILHLLVEIMVN